MPRRTLGFLARHKTLIGAAVSLGFLVWVFKDVNMRELWDALTRIHFVWLVVSTALFMAAMYLRALRWGWLFRPGYDIPGSRLFQPMMVGFAFNSIFPGRAGEFARAFVVGKREGTGFPRAFATVFAERLFDAVTLLSILGICMSFMPPIDPTFEIEAMGAKVSGAQIQPVIEKLTIMCGVMVAGVLFLMIPGIERRLVALVDGAPLVPGGVRGAVVNLITGVIRGFDSIRNPRAMAAVVFYSIAVWGVTGLSTLALARGMEGVSDMNFLQALSVMVLIGLFIAVPASPGYWGPFEAGCVFSLAMLGVERDPSRATAYAIVLHLTQYVPIVLPGLYFARKLGVEVTKVREDDDTAPSPGVEDGQNEDAPAPDSDAGAKPSQP